MACKGSGVQIPSAPPPQHRRSKACPSFSVASCRFLVARFVPPACHSVLAAGSLSEPLQPRPAHPMRPRWRRPGRPSRAGSAARRPRRNAPSDQTAPVPPDLNLPHAQQVVVVQRHTTDLTGSNARTELVYALSSQPAHHASPQRLGAWPAPTGRSKRSTGSATSPSPKTPAASAPPPAPWSWLPCASRDRAAPPGRSHPDRPHAALGQPESRPRPGVPRPPMNPLPPKPDHAEVLDAPVRGFPSATTVTRWAPCSIFEGTSWPKRAAP
jgi:hypothetical protein